jgi:hypothetical protein
VPLPLPEDEEKVEGLRADRIIGDGVRIFFTALLSGRVDAGGRSLIRLIV